jgi:hypothetical protein
MKTLPSFHVLEISVLCAIMHTPGHCVAVGAKCLDIAICILVETLVFTSSYSI